MVVVEKLPLVVEKEPSLDTKEEANVRSNDDVATGHADVRRSVTADNDDDDRDFTDTLGENRNPKPDESSALHS